MSYEQCATSRCDPPGRRCRHRLQFSPEGHPLKRARIVRARRGKPRLDMLFLGTGKSLATVVGKFSDGGTPKVASRLRPFYHPPEHPPANQGDIGVDFPHQYWAMGTVRAGLVIRKAGRID